MPIKEFRILVKRKIQEYTCSHFIYSLMSFCFYFILHERLPFQEPSVCRKRMLKELLNWKLINSVIVFENLQLRKQDFDDENASVETKAIMVTIIKVVLVLLVMVVVIAMLMIMMQRKD